MALTANYSTPESEWTRAIDAALAEWSEHIAGSGVLNIDLRFDPNLQYLAAVTTPNYVDLGTMDGTRISMPGGTARLQGWDFDGLDTRLTINPSHAWHFGEGTARGKYTAIDVMLHELGHALFMKTGGPRTTPFDLWREDQSPGTFADKSHFNDRSLMYPDTQPGTHQHITNLDMDAARASGIPTTGDDLLWLIPGAKLDGGGGNDTGIWLGAFDSYDAQLSRIPKVEFRGDNALNEFQQNAYKLYRAGMGRDPDLAGFQWWNTNKPQTFEDMAAAFSHSPEFIGKFGAPGTRDRGQYIGDLYKNILGRSAEQAGVDYWNSRTDLDDVGLLANIGLAPENEIGVPSFTL